ncbi:MAG: alkaline phosphatase [Verrucomicrobiota bacterium]
MPKVPSSTTRRDFLKGASLASAASLFASSGAKAATPSVSKNTESIQAKNLIFLVADGMGTGTLSLAHHWKMANQGNHLHWMDLYEYPGLRTALQDTASASSPVTDSAAAASAWGSGKRVNNRSINIGTNGEVQTPIMTYAKHAVKATGVVSTCRVTHATPAGFIANVPHRDSENDIADQYLEREVDVILGGGLSKFDRRSQDGVNHVASFKEKGYSIAFSKNDLSQSTGSSKLLGLFHQSHIPYAIDRKFDKSLESIPSLPEMMRSALSALEDAPEGFVLQVEAGRVDHAGHGNDPAAILHEQLEFDDCIPLAVEFAKKNPETMVIVTTDHGTGGCQLNGSGAGYNDSEKSMNKLKRFKGSFESLEFTFRKTGKLDKQLFKKVTGIQVSDTQAQQIQDAIQAETTYLSSAMTSAVKEDLFEKTAVGWTSSAHTSECVEFLAIGSGANLVKPFMKNYEVFELMVRALGLKAV